MSRRTARGLAHQVDQIDRDLYLRVARLATPALDAPLRRLARFADYSRLWLVVAGVLAAAGGRTGRRAALSGVVAIGATSFVVNQPMKLAGGRSRPDRVAALVPRSRWVPLPASTSFPSGHSASAAAFATAVGDAIPALRVPLRVGCGAVAFSRVYTGVHYPGDVLVGLGVGAIIGRAVGRLGDRFVGSGARTGETSDGRPSS